MRFAALLVTLAVLFTAGDAQTLEDWLEAAPDPEALALWLDELRTTPLDLNRATVQEVAALPFCDAQIARQILDARTRHGSFHSLSQVLTLYGLTATQRDVLRTFTTVQIARRGRVPDVSAYLSTGADSKKWRRAGDWWTRGRADFRPAQGPRGFVFVKRTADRPEIAEQVSAGLELQPKNLPSRVLIGEFQEECGTGLVFASAYGMANWLSTREANGPGAARGLALRPSSNQLSVFRGAALELRGQPITFAVLGSSAQLNAAANGTDIERLTEGQSGSSIELELARRDQVEERLLGFTAQGILYGVSGGVAGYEAHYAPALSGAEDALLPLLTGNRVDVGSVFAQTRRGATQFSGELAASRPGGFARQAALEVRQEQFGLILYHIHADADFFSPRAKPWGGFGEAANNANAAGVRTHANWPGHALWISASASRTPFRTATLPLSRTASEWDALWRLNFLSAVRLDWSAGRREREEYAAWYGSRRVVLDRARVDLFGGEGEMYRIRYEIRSATTTGKNTHSLGTLLYLQARARLLSASLWGRLTFFNFPDQDVATAVYESSAVGGYPLVPLTGTGRRATLMFARDWHDAALALKLAHTHSATPDATHENLEFGLQLSYRRY